MADNSWIKDDMRKTDSGNKILKTKVIITAIIVLIGTIGLLALNGVGSNATQYQSEGIVIDFGDYSTYWTTVDYNTTSNPVELLGIACDENFKTSPVFTDGKLYSIDNGTQVLANDSTHSWDLWYVNKGSFDFTKSETYDIDASDYTVTVWAYTESGKEPTVAVDATATSIYGYSQPHNAITLSPVCTELVASMDAANIITGTDHSSNYPDIIRKGHDNGSIKEVGTYTDPSYESIIHLNPDMVFCDSSCQSHVNMAHTLRGSNINSVVIYDGEDLETVMDNIFIVGTAMNYNLRATYVAQQIELALNSIAALTDASEGNKTLITLGSNASPFIAGTSTYVDDILYTVNSSNAINDSHWPSGTSKRGWINITSAIIMELNPAYIIVYDYGEFSVDEYDLMISSLSDEWKSTDAYANGNIYLFTDGLGEMAERSGPRIAQLTEITARVTNPGAFTDGITVPHAIGNDYQQYLTYTKNLGFGD
jgi:iron complex transport system substrate-binding protein